MRAGDEKKRCLREALFDLDCYKGESILEFIARRDAQFGRATAFGLQLPDTAMGPFMIEGAKLSEQMQQNLATLTQGSDKYKDVVDALRKLDVAATQHLTRAPASSTTGHNRSTYYQTEVETENQESNDEEEESSEMEFDEELEKELDRLDLREDQIQEVFLALDKSRRPEKRTVRRSWKEMQELKRQLKKERHFGGNGNGSQDEKGQEFQDGGRKGDGKGRRSKMPIEQLKKVSRCANCGKRGHWHRECTAPRKDRGQAAAVISGIERADSAEERQLLLQRLGDLHECSPRHGGGVHGRRRGVDRQTGIRRVEA